MKKQLTLIALAATAAFGLWQAIEPSTALAGPSSSEPVGHAVSSAHAPAQLSGFERPASLPDLIESVRPAVVNISTKSIQKSRSMRPGQRQTVPEGAPFEHFFRRFFENQSQRFPGRGGVSQSLGSGFLVDPDGFIVTNNHVVAGAEEITVTLDDGRQFQAELIGTDPRSDLALVKIDAGGQLPYAELGGSDQARVGEWVVAIGNPFGLGGSATTGIISARGRDIQAGPLDDFLQIDAPINSGNSGGPLFDTQGRVIGINTAIFSPNGGNVGIGFAIPSEQAAPILEQLRQGGSIERGWLGVSIRPLDPEAAEYHGLDSDRGALVTDVVDGSPAASAGLQAGDVLVTLDGEPLESIRQLQRTIVSARPGDRVPLGVQRDGRSLELEAILGTIPSSPAS